MNKPFIFLFLSLAAGIFFSQYIIIGLLIAVIIIFYLIITKNKNIIFIFLFFYLGLFYSVFKMYYLPENHIKKLKLENKNNFIIHVTEMTEETEEKIYFNGDLISIENEKEKITGIKGKIRVTIVKNIGIKIKYGDILKINGILKEPIEPGNTQDFNYKKFLQYKSIYHTLFVREKDVDIIDNKTPDYFLKFSCDLKEKLINIIYTFLPEEEAKVLEGIMLGNYRVLPEEINDYFKRTGTAHILAVSGMNVGLIALLIFLILKIFYFSKKLRAIITLIFITIFAVITGADPSIVRATFMAYVALIGYILEYDSDLINSLAIAGFFILLINPFELFSVSFQLSFLATFGIIYFGGYISKKFSNIPKLITETIFTTFTSQIFIIPVMANTFHQISIISVIANIFIVPVSGIITILGFVLWIIGMISMHVAAFFGATIWILIKTMIFVVKILSSVPFAAVSVKSMNLIFIFLYYFFFLNLPYEDIDIYVKNISMKKVTGIALIILTIFHIFTFKKDFYIYFPKIKKIGAVFVKTDNNKKILILGCDSEVNLKEIRNNIIIYLKKQGINILDYLILFSVKNEQNYKIIKNNFFIIKILSDIYMVDKNIQVVSGNTNIYLDKNIFLSFFKNYIELNIKNKKFIFTKYLDNTISDANENVIFSCNCFISNIDIEMLQKNKIIINSSLMDKYYKMKIPKFVWDVNSDGENLLFF